MRWWRWSVTAAVTVTSIAGGQASASASRDLPPGPGTSGSVNLSGSPVLSVRRLPDWVEATAAQQRLQIALTKAAGPQLTAAPRPVACVMVTQGSRVLYDLDATDEFLPASNMKLLTATAVLDRLGATDRLTTMVRVGAPIAAGVVHGNLYLVGGGDPLLRTAAYVASLDPPQPVYTSLDQLALQVRRAGVRVITRSVVGDDGRYDRDRTVATWKPSYVEEGDVAPLSALEVNDDLVPPPTPPATSTLADADDPPVAAAATFIDLLRADGVTVQGGAAEGATSAGAPELTAVESPTLGTEVDAMLRVSDDTAAELFTKELGYRVSGSGTTAAGTAVVRADLAADQLPVSQLVNLDGSGLDRGDRSSCDLLVSALRRAGPDSVLGQGLPVAGRTGTLAHRFLGTPAVGRIRAKTGTLDDVSSLSGYSTPVSTAPTASLRQPLVFSILVNGMPNTAGETIVDRIALALTAYPAVPPITLIEPVAHGAGTS